MQDLMQTIDTSDKVFHDGNPAIGELGTIVPAKWLNNVQGAVRNLQSELLTVLGSAELASDPLKQDQLKQAIAKIYAPLESPALTGEPTAPTATRFDASEKVATTEFVQSAIGNSNTIYAISSTQTLTASHAGSVIGLTTGGITVTLPALADLPNGAKFSFVNTTAASATNLVCKAAEGIVFANGIKKSNLSVGVGDSIQIVKFGSVWVAEGGTLQAGPSASFGSLLATNGYQKLPGGLILQWGTTLSAANDNTIINFPIAFPNACLSFCASGMQGAASTQAYVTVNSRSTTAAVTNCFIGPNGGTLSRAVSVGGVQVWWQAIGY